MIPLLDSKEVQSIWKYDKLYMLMYKRSSSVLRSGSIVGITPWTLCVIAEKEISRIYIVTKYIECMKADGCQLTAAHIHAIKQAPIQVAEKLLLWEPGWWSKSALEKMEDDRRIIRIL